MPNRLPNSQHEKDAPDSLATQLAKARLDRIKGGGVNGAQASSIGLTLVGCITAGALAGWWLDKHFGTQFWTPVLFLVGVAAGFRQMMLTIRETNAFEARRKAEEKTEREALLTKAGHVMEGLKSDEAEPQAELVRARVFQVPPPPSASFDKVTQPIEYSNSAADAVLDERTLTEKLLNETDEADDKVR